MSTKLVVGCIVCLVSAAHAQVSSTDGQVSTTTAGPSDLTISTFDPSNAVAPISLVEGPGIKVGEGTVLHPAFGRFSGTVVDPAGKPNADARLLLGPDGVEVTRPPFPANHTRRVARVGQPDRAVCSEFNKIWHCLSAR